MRLYSKSINWKKNLSGLFSCSFHIPLLSIYRSLWNIGLATIVKIQRKPKENQAFLRMSHFIEGGLPAPPQESELFQNHPCPFMVTNPALLLKI